MHVRVPTSVSWKYGRVRATSNNCTCRLPSCYGVSIDVLPILHVFFHIASESHGENPFSESFPRQPRQRKTTKTPGASAEDGSWRSFWRVCGQYFFFGLAGLKVYIFWRLSVVTSIKFYIQHVVLFNVSKHITLSSNVIRKP